MGNIFTTDEVLVDKRTENNKEVQYSLNKLLKNLQIHYRNTAKYQGNADTSDLGKLHSNLEFLHRETADMIDETAGRISAMGVAPEDGSGPVRDSSISDGSHISGVDKMIEFIISSNKLLISNVINIIKKASQADDDSTIDIYSGYLSSLQKNNWILKTFLG